MGVILTRYLLNGMIPQEIIFVGFIKNLVWSGALGENPPSRVSETPEGLRSGVSEKNIPYPRGSMYPWQNLGPGD